MATIGFNPYATSNAAGSFAVQSGGYIQGTAQVQPASRFDLAGGVLAASETQAMYGGVAIYEQIPNPANPLTAPNRDLGSIVGRATTLTQTSATGIAGFAVFDQNTAAVNSPSSPVPLVGSGGSVNFYRLGSLAKIVVQADPGIASIVGGSIGQNVSWDFNNQLLVPYSASASTIAASTYTWASTAGGRLTVVAASATNVSAVGDEVYITGATNTGTGGATVVNGSFTVDTFTDNQHFTLAAPGNATIFGTIGGSPLINNAGGILPVKVVDFNFGNSLIVNYNPTTNNATWSRAGSTAVILI